MNSADITFRTVSTKENADEIIALLEKHDIQTELKVDQSYLGSSVAGSSPNPSFEIHIPEKDASKAEELYTKMAEEKAQFVPDGHYLLDFSDEELQNVIIEHYEWNELDVIWAKKILQERGAPIDKEQIQEQQKQRVEALAQPKKLHQGWIIFGYILAITGYGISVFLGLFWWQTKNKLPNGKKVSYYDDKTINHAKNIFWIGLLTFVVNLISEFYAEVSTLSLLY